MNRIFILLPRSCPGAGLQGAGGVKNFSVGICDGAPSTARSSLYFSSKTYVVGTQKNCLNETVLLSTQNMLELMGKKIITILRSLNFIIWIFDTRIYFFIWNVEIDITMMIINNVSMLTLFPDSHDFARLFCHLFMFLGSLYLRNEFDFWNVHANIILRVSCRRPEVFMIP